MANQTGTLTSSQGSAIIGTSPNDTITFTPTSGTYTVEYPLGTTAISASTSTQSLSVSGGQVRVTCATGSVSWSLADGNDGTPLTQTELGSVRSLVSGAGIGPSGLKTVLYGDSMTDWFHYVQSASSATYDASTRQLTIGTPSAHNAWVGLPVNFWHYGYQSLRNRRRIAVLSIPTTTSLVFQLPDAPTDLPNGALTGILQFRQESGHGVANPITQLQIRMGWPLNIVHNGAKSGEYSGAGLANVQADLAAYSPQLVIMQAYGINDQTYSGVDAPSPFLSESQTIANLRAIFDAILATGANLIVGTITAVVATEARGTKDVMDRITRINAAIWAYAQDKSRMQVYDSYGATIDPTDATGLALATYHRSDKIHWSIKGALRVAKLIEPLVRKIIASPTFSTLPKAAIQSHNTGALTVSSATGSGATVTVVLSANHKWRAGETIRVTGMGDAAANGVFSIATVNATTGLTYDAPGLATSGAISGTKIISRSDNIFRNNLLATASGGTNGTNAIGTVAALLKCEDGLAAGVGWAATTSVAADDSGFGNKQVMVVTAAATTTNRSQITVTGTTAFATEMAGNGRSYIWECAARLKSSAWASTPICDIRAYLSVTGSDGKIYTAEALYGSDGTNEPTILEDVDWHLRTPALYIPVGVTVSSAVFMFWVRHNGSFSAGPTLTMEMARIAVRDVT